MWIAPPAVNHRSIAASLIYGGWLNFPTQFNPARPSVTKLFHIKQSAMVLTAICTDVWLLTRNWNIHFLQLIEYCLIDSMHARSYDMLCKGSDTPESFLSNCLEGKGEDYQVCSVQYCVQQLCTVRCTHI